MYFPCYLNPLNPVRASFEALFFLKAHPAIGCRKIFQADSHAEIVPENYLFFINSLFKKNEKSGPNKTVLPDVTVNIFGIFFSLKIF
jgi:hypothetical protein